MSLVIPADCTEMALHFALANSQHDFVCTLGLRYNGSDFQNDANAVAATFGSIVMPELVDAYHFTKAVWRNSVGSIKERLTGHQGGKAQSAATPNTTYLIRKITGLPGRRERGRMFLPGLAEINVEATGLLTPANQTAIQGVFATWMDAIHTQDFVPVLLHNASPDPTVNTAPTTITSFQCDLMVATQRDRMR